MVPVAGSRRMDAKVERSNAGAHNSNGNATQNPSRKRAVGRGEEVEMTELPWVLRQ